MLLPAVQKVREAAVRASDIPELSDVAAAADDLLAIISNDLDRARNTLEVSESGELPAVQDVEVVLRTLQSDADELRALIGGLTPPGDGDPDARTAAIELRRGLVKTLADLHRVERSVAFVYERLPAAIILNPR